MESSSSSMEFVDRTETKRVTASLHSVRKPPAKPWKKPVAAAPPPKVYKVDSSNFRRIVQKLTGSAEFQSRRLQNVAPPPLVLVKSKPTCNYTVPAPLQPFRSQETAPTGVENDFDFPFYSPPLEQQQPSVNPLDLFSPPPPSMAPLELFSPPPPSMTPLGLFSPPPLTPFGLFSSPPLTPLSLFSPSWFNWCSLPILSPGTLASLET